MVWVVVVLVVLVLVIVVVVVVVVVTFVAHGRCVLFSGEVDDDELAVFDVGAKCRLIVGDAG